MFLLFSIDIDECAGNSSVCDLNAKCNNTIGSYECHCLPGFTGNGSLCQGKNAGIIEGNFLLFCVDIDECAGNSSLCNPNAECYNIIGSYICYCHSGYERSNTTDCTGKFSF